MDATDSVPAGVHAAEEHWKPPLFAISTWVLMLSAVVLFLMYDSWKHQFLSSRGFVGPKPTIMLGNTCNWLFHKNGIQGFHDDNIAKFGKIFSFYSGWTPVLIVADADLVRAICIKDFASFPNRKAPPIDSKPFDKALTVLRDEHWKDVRGIISPTFSGSKMKLMVPLINGCLDPTIRKVTKHCEEGKCVQFKDIYGGYLLDAIGTTAFGLNLNSQENENDPFLANAKKIFQIRFSLATFVLLFMPFLAPVINWFGVSSFDNKVIKFFSDMLDQAVELRKSGSEKRVDLLQLMLDAQRISEEDRAGATEEEKLEDEHRKKMSKKSLTADELHAQGLTFFLAGYETSNATLGFASYSLATNPDIQDKLIAEIDAVAPRRDDITYENIAKMTYLDWVVHETLRLYPPSVLTARETGSDYEYNGYTIPKGIEVFFSIWAIHRDPELWEEPDKFDPDRFAPEKREKRHPCAWLPFGAGPRNCIGMRLALLQVKMGLVRMLQNFRLETCAETEIPPNFGKFGFLSPPTGVKLSAVPRS